MSRIGLIGLLILLAGGTYAQQDYFVLIQADNNQPFYVRMGEQVFSSSPQGHLILSQLKDSSYPITIGFPQKLFPEEDFSVAIDKKDLEFQLRYAEGKGWELFNTETLELQMPVKKDTIPVNLPQGGVKKDDPFSRLMAGLVSDTAVMYTTYTLIADSSSRKPDAEGGGSDSAGRKKDAVRDMAIYIRRTDSSAQKLDSSAWKPDSPARGPDSLMRRPESSSPGPDSLTHRPDSSGRSRTIPAHNASSAATAAAPKAVKTSKRSVIEKISEHQTTAVLHLAYTDHARGRKTDTIEVSIPIDTASGPHLIPPAPLSPAMRPLQKDSMNTLGADSIPKKVKEKPVVMNSDCRNFALDEDVDKLKMKWQTIATDEGKITAAKKVFRVKCFSTNQLKSLSDAFTLEGARYRFLESAYPFVSDDHFRELYSVFSDPVYIGKFKTLVGAGSQ